jgi:hypothetical protein
MQKTGISILFIIYCISCQAQNDTIRKLSYCDYNLKLAYNSSLIYPGASAGVEFLLQSKNIQRSGKNDKDKSFSKTRLISGNLNWYHHPDFHDNLYLTAEWVMRRTNRNGFISEFSCGPGISRTFLGGTTYKVNDSGGISVVKLAGYYYALITLGGGFGIDFAAKKKMPVSAVARLNLIAMFPYNSTIYFRPVLELGIRFNPLQIKSHLKKD